MNDGNMWNREFRDNDSIGNRNDNYRPRDNRPGNRPYNNQNSQYRPNGNSQNGGNSQAKLLEEIVQQNHTIIGLLRGIKNALVSGEPFPQHNGQNRQPKLESEQKTAELSAEPVKSETPRSSAKKQFVMRFDDKKPLNLDLEEPAAVDAAVEPAFDYEDENSVGETDPFAFFGAKEND